LRVREGDTKIRQHLTDTFSKLFGIYGEGSRFEITYTANAVLQGGIDGKFSLWFGQTFEAAAGGEGDETPIGGAAHRRRPNKQVDFQSHDVVRNLGDIEYLPLDFNAQQFDLLYQANHEESNVSVVQLVNYVFVIRTFLDNYQLQHTSSVGRIQKLF
jgi:hypothetical protein